MLGLSAWKPEIYPQNVHKNSHMWCHGFIIPAPRGQNRQIELFDSPDQRAKPAYWEPCQWETLFQNKMVPEKWYPRPPSDLQMHTQACTSHLCTYVHAHTLQSLFSNAWKRQAALLLALFSDKHLIIIDNLSMYVYSSSKQITYDSGGCLHKNPQFSYDVLHIYGSQCFYLMTIIKTTYIKT